MRLHSCSSQLREEHHATSPLGALTERAEAASRAASSPSASESLFGASGMYGFTLACPLVSGNCTGSEAYILLAETMLWSAAACAEARRSPAAATL